MEILTRISLQRFSDTPVLYMYTVNLPSQKKYTFQIPLYYTAYTVYRSYSRTTIHVYRTPD
jgi:hypothetical protein